jgi:hypothetical protein
MGDVQLRCPTPVCDIETDIIQRLDRKATSGLSTQVPGNFRMECTEATGSDLADRHRASQGASNALSQWVCGMVHESRATTSQIVCNRRLSWCATWHLMRGNGPNHRERAL